MRAIEVRDLLVGLLHKVAGSDRVPDSLDDNIPMHDQMQLDSMDFLDLVIEIRKTTSINIPEVDYKSLDTIAALEHYITTHTVWIEKDDRGIRPQEPESRTHPKM